MVDAKEFNSERAAVVVMAKSASPGGVKTRLIGDLSPDQAARVHGAMMDCVMERVAAMVPGDHVLALAGTKPQTALTGWRVMDQGTGDLGHRLDRVWQGLGGGPVVFFGVDSPDVPCDTLARIVPALTESDAAVGPTEDGGYWTLAARAYAPALLRGIDWGSASVYHQTERAAADAGLRLARLPRWHDVDEPADLWALQRRLESAREPALIRLRERLLSITGTPSS